MRASPILDRILNELKPGKPDLIERKVIGPAGILKGQGHRAQIPERHEPRPENRPDGFIRLHVDSAHLPAAVVVVEVDGELFRLRFQRDSEVRVGAHSLAEVLLYVSGRAQQTLLLAAPESDANGAARRQTDQLEYPHGFEADRSTRAVISRSRAPVP